jgi:hypothetical protein
MDPAPFLEFERAQEIMDDEPGTSYEDALSWAKYEAERRGA